MENLRRKFIELSKAKPPTGNPYMAEEYDRAYKISQDIIRSTDTKIHSATRKDAPNSNKINDPADNHPVEDKDCKERTISQGIADMNDTLKQRARPLP
jgi:hypothetical protein